MDLSSTTVNRISLLSLITSLLTGVGLLILLPPAEESEYGRAEASQRARPPQISSRAAVLERASKQDLLVAGYSVIEEAMLEGIFPKFEAEWRRSHSDKIVCHGWFGSLGEITNELANGLPAHVAILSAEIGVQELAVAGVIPWEEQQALPHDGILGRSPVVIVTREGNPLDICSFFELARPELRVIQPDPLVSGSGVWAIFAEFGAGRRMGGSWNSGCELVIGIARNVSVKVSSALEARSLFESGIGDALVTLEQDALRSIARGALHGTIVYPPSTVMSEPSLVVIDRQVTADDREKVDAFTQFIWSSEGQQTLAEYGLRRVDGEPEEGEGFPAIEDPFLVDDLGGWKAAKRDLIDGLWRYRVVRTLRR